MARHHYVPQFLLKLFTDPDVPLGQTPYLWVHEPAGEWGKQSPKNAAQEPDYYALPAEGERDGQELERLFSQMESISAPALRKILKGKLVTVDVKRIVAGFIAFMLARVPVQLDHVGESMAEVARTIMRVLREAATVDPAGFRAHLEQAARDTGIAEIATLPPDALNPEDYDITTDRMAALRPLIALVPAFSDYLSRMDWTFFRTFAGRFFVTSDHPVGIVDPVVRTFETGFGIPTAEITFALSCSAAVVMRWHSPGAMRWRDREATVDEVAQINRRTALRAEGLFAPNPVFPGSKEILANRTQPLERSAATRTYRAPAEIGYVLEFRYPTPLEVDPSWLVPLVEHTPNEETRGLLRALDARWAPRS